MELDLDTILLECEEAMDNALKHLKHELRGIRTGHASVGLVENVRVEAYGTTQELRNMAALSAPEPTQIIVKPFDPGTVSAIVKAIEVADLGLNPQSDGKVIRVPIPPLSGDRRKQLASQAKSTGETAKISIRNARRDANKHLDLAGKDKTLGYSEDQIKDAKEDIQKNTKQHEETIDKLVKAKSEEIMEL